MDKKIINYSICKKPIVKESVCNFHYECLSFKDKNKIKNIEEPTTNNKSLDIEIQIFKDNEIAIEKQQNQKQYNKNRYDANKEYFINHSMNYYNENKNIIKERVDKYNKEYYYKKHSKKNIKKEKFVELDFKVIFDTNPDNLTLYI
jgi:hypothetical protein